MMKKHIGIFLYEIIFFKERKKCVKIHLVEITYVDH